MYVCIYIIGISYFNSGECSFAGHNTKEFLKIHISIKLTLAIHIYQCLVLIQHIYFKIHLSLLLCVNQGLVNHFYH